MRMKKIFAVSLIFLMIFQVFAWTGMTVLAKGEAGNLRISVRMDKEQLQLGDVVEAQISLDFGENPLEHGGVFVLLADLKYDPTVLEPINQGNSNSPIYAVKGEILGNDNLTSSVPEPGILRILYGDNRSKDITQSGLFATVSFQVLDTARPGVFSLDFDRTKAAYSQEQIPGQTQQMTFQTGYQEWNFKVLAPFTFDAPFIVEKGENIKVSGTTEVTPLSLTLLSPSGAEIFSQELLTDANGKFQQEIPTQESFDSGDYRLVFRYNRIVLDRTIVLKAPGENVVKPEETSAPTQKPEPTQAPEPAASSRPGQSGSGTGGRFPSGEPVERPDGTAKPSASSVPDVENQKLPNDIEGFWAEDYIDYVYEQKLMNGYEDGSFKPDAGITRAEFCTVMYRFLNLEPENGKVFEDTDGHWAQSYISALAAKGIVSGVSEVSFEPEEWITREQIAAILDRAFELGGKTPESVFADEAEISDWAFESVYDVLAAGYMKGDENNCFAPLANATRAEIATIIYRLHTEMKA